MVCFSNDGELIISASADKTVRIWNVKTRSEIVSLHGRGDDFFKGCYVTPDDNYLLAISYDKAIKVWNLRSHTLMYTINETDDIFACSVSNGSSFFASGLSGGICRVYEIAYPNVDIPNSSSTENLNPMPFSPSTAKVLGLKATPKEHSSSQRQRRNTFQAEKQDFLQLDKVQLVKENQELTSKVMQLQSQLKQINDLQVQLKQANGNMKEQSSLVDKYKLDLENQGALVGALQKHLGHEKEEKLKYYKSHKLLVDQMIPELPQELNDLEITLKLLLQKVEKKKTDIASKPSPAVKDHTQHVQNKENIVVKEIPPPKGVQDIPSELPKVTVNKEPVITMKATPTTTKPNGINKDSVNNSTSLPQETESDHQ